MTPPLPEIEVKPVTHANWPDFEKLFEAKGGPRYCWCMAWREMANRTEATNADRKAALRERVENGVPIGLLAYLDGEPVGWCSVAPRTSFLRGLSPESAGQAAAPLGLAEKGRNASDSARKIWSITCFFVPRRHRRAGLAGRLLDAAVEHAFRNGAETVEAYPVNPDSPSYRFMGFVGMFRSHGFRESGMAGSRRHVMELRKG